MQCFQGLHGDLRLIVRALGAMGLLIAGGVVMAEHAIIDLTHYAQQLEFINLRVAQTGAYTFFFFGESMNVQGCFPLGKIFVWDHKLLLDFGGRVFMFDAHPGYDAHGLWRIIGTWMLAAKQMLHVLWSNMAYWCGVIYAQLADVYCGMF